jgi:hypothetical protein
VLQNDAAHLLNGFKIYFLSFRYNAITKIKMAKSAWMLHLAAFRKDHPDMDPKKVFGEAAKTYKKKQSGGMEALGSSPFTASPKLAHMVPTDLDTQVATQYSGGSKRRGSKHGSKRRGTKRHGTKRRGSKRRH